MKLKELGKILKEERIRQGLSLNDIKESTKLSEYILQIIEDGKLEKMPVEVYARSFIKSYIKELGIETEEVWELLEEIYPVQKSNQEQINTPTVMLPTVLSDKHKRLIAFVTLFLLILIVIVWFNFSFVQTKRETRQSENVGTLQELPVESKTGAEDEVMEDGQATVQSFEDFGKNEQLAIDKDGADLNKKSKSASTDKKETEISTGRTVSGVESADGEIHRSLKLTAVDGECWFMAIVDGREIERTLYPGKSISFSFTQKLRLKVGNASAVKLELNGKPYPLVGSGSVRIVEFTAKND